MNDACNIVQKACPGAFAWHGKPVKLYPWRIDASVFDHREKSPDICRVRRRPCGRPLLQEPGGQVSLHRARAPKTRLASPHSRGNFL
ncbi:MAG TPA: hypothetical protein VKM55_25465, partial [Candidatus Lokiarchaeia archaeon]|nr:hypothetical protein [Candidatus Lokiarchaeia archaeon]